MSAQIAKPMDMTVLQPALDNLNAIKQELNHALLEREDAVHVSLVALIARQHVVLLGPPGTGKSMLINRLSAHIAPQSGGLSNFVRLLTKFSTPEELFGPISVPALEQGRYEHITSGTLITAHIAFLDEVFKANSAILNSLLTIVNERRFDNGGQRVNVPLISLFGASNELPADSELDAFWDRFALRLMIPQVSKNNFFKLLKLMSNGANKPPSAFLPMSDLQALQNAVEQIIIPDSVYNATVQLHTELSKIGIEVSNRRWGILMKLMRANALLDGRAVVEEDDFEIAIHCLWQEPEQIREIRKIVGRLANPINAKAVELGDKATSVYEAVIAELSGKTPKKSEIQALISAIAELNQILNEVTEIGHRAKAEARNPAKIRKIYKQIAAHSKHLSEIVTPSYNTDTPAF